MKNTSFLCAALLCSASFLGFTAHAATTSSGENYTYNAQKFQNVCKGKSVGAPVSIVMGRAIFNGTCELQFVANRYTVNGLDSATLAQACQGKQPHDVTSVSMNNRDMKGKCVLAFNSIEPSMTTP
jgi:hypothetical protein